MNSMVTEELLNIKRGGIRYVAWYDSSSWNKSAAVSFLNAAAI